MNAGASSGTRADESRVYEKLILPLEQIHLPNNPLFGRGCGGDIKRLFVSKVFRVEIGVAALEHQPVSALRDPE